MSSVIECRKIWKIYNEGTTAEVRALQDVNIKIEKGDFAAVIGPSGSGKSTLMYLLGCLDLPTRGEIYLDGKDIAKLHESDLATIRGKKIGFIFQAFNLLPTLTALENVMLPMVFQGTNEAERKKLASHFLSMVGLKERENHRPNELSGGEMQRVAIARSLVNHPEVILADEPTGNLDTTTSKNIMKIFKELHEKYKKTLIIVTHDPSVAGYAKKIVSIVDGKVTVDHGKIGKYVWQVKNGKK